MTTYRETIWRSFNRLDHHVFEIREPGKSSPGYTAALTPREAAETRRQFKARGWREAGRPRVRRYEQ